MTAALSTGVATMSSLV